MDDRLDSKEKRYYCGPYYFPQWVKKFLSGWFNIPCMIHDRDYRMSNDKLESDWRFYKNMARLSRCNPLKHIVAILFFISVLIMGWFSYSTGEKGREKFKVE